MIPYLNEIMSHIGQNQFATGGLLLGAGGIIIAYLRNLPAAIGQKLMRSISMEVEITSNNELFRHVNNFFADKPPSKWTRNFKATYHEKDTLREGIKISLGQGSHFFAHKKMWMTCKRGFRKEDVQRGESSEYFQIRFFTRNKERIVDFLSEAIISSEPEHASIKIYTTDRWGDSWDLIKRAKLRYAKNIILKEGLMEGIISDIESFYEKENWFEGVGIPYRRGYLFYGPPGNGKTSTIICLASHFQIPVYIIPKLNDTNIEKLTSLLSELPKKAFVVFEDIDAMLHKSRKKSDDDDDDAEKKDGGEKEEKMNLSGLLNALDGITTPEGHIVFMTTNHKQNLDAALIRPGRIDRQIEFTNPSEQELAKIFQKFFPGADSQDSEEFAKNLAPRQYSAAQVQEFLVSNRDKEQALVESKKVV